MEQDDLTDVIWFIALDYEHMEAETCENCDADGLEKRLTKEKRREIAVHSGTIASANSVMKSAKKK